MSKLWLWVNMMQLYNSLTILPIEVPVNVLQIQSKYNGIINMEVIPESMINDILDFLMFWQEDPDESEDDDKLI